MKSEDFLSGRKRLPYELDYACILLISALAYRHRLKETLCNRSSRRTIVQNYRANADCHTPTENNRDKLLESASQCDDKNRANTAASEKVLTLQAEKPNHKPGVAILPQT